MAELKSLLSDPNFLARASAGNVLADALRSSDFLKTAAVASSEGNDLAAPNSFIDDLSNLSYYELDAKYGREIAENRGEFQKEVVRQQAVRAKPRSALDIGIDTGIAAGAAGVGMVGGLAAATVGVAGAINEFGTGGRETRLSEGSTYIARKTAELTGWMTGFQSEEIQQRGELIDIEAQLDQQDSTDQMNRKIAAGYDPKMADYERLGRDFLDFGDRFYKDPAVAANLITGALGSVWPSAKMAQAGVKFAEKLAKKTTNKFVNRAAGTVGSSLGIGLAESSGTYTDTVGFVMDLSPEDMQNSEEYRALIQQGKTPDAAQRIVAASTAMEAATRQLPVAATLGLVAARFNTNPFNAFKGRSLLGIFKEVGIQAFEEGGQGISSTYSQSVAVQHQVDEDIDLGAGLGASLGEGVFAGAGMAGVIGAPSLAKRGARTGIRGAAIGGLVAADMIAKGVRKGAAAADKAFTGVVIDATGEGRDIAGKTARAQRVTQVADALDATSKAAAKVAKVAEPVTAPVAKVVKKGAAVVNEAVVKPAMQKVEDFNERPNTKLLLEGLEASNQAVDDNPDNEAIKAVDQIIMDLTTTQASKMTDEEVLDAADKILALHKEARNIIDPKTLDNVRTMLSTPEFRKIRERFTVLRQAAVEAAPDLNQTQTADTKVTKATIKETLEVAALDPAKVNPEHIGKILKSEDHGLNNDQIKMMEVAAAVSLAVNTHRNTQVEVSSNESIALSKKPAYNGKDAPEVIGFEKTAQSLQITGYTDKRGQKLRSVSDFVSDWMQAIQGDGTVADANEDSGSISAEDLATNFGMLVEHLRNKVRAYNLSFKNRAKNGTGTTVQFRSIVGGNRMVDAGAPGGAQGVWVHIGSPQSVANAEAAANDARVIAEVYNILVKAYPKSFPGGEVAIPKLNITPTTAAVEASEASDSNAEASAKAEVSVVEETEQAKTEEPKLDTTTPEEDAIARKLHDELRALKKEATVLREAKDDITEQGAELEAAFDAIAAQRKLIAAKDAEITAMFEARRDAKKEAVKPKDTTAVDETIAPGAIDEEAETAPSNQKSQEVTKIQDIDDDAAFDDDAADPDGEGGREGPVTKMMGETFNERGEEIGYDSGADILNLLHSGTNTTIEYRRFARKLFKTLIENMNKRLADIKVSRDDPRSLKQAILDGDEQSHIRDFKNTMMVDPVTGEYDPDLLSIAVVAMIDWMSSVRSSDPNSKPLREKLQKMGVEIHDLNKKDFFNILNGVSPRFVAETMSKRIVKMWNLKVNKNRPMVDARGAAEGIVKELIEVIADSFPDMIEIHNIPTKYTKKNGDPVTTPTINVKGLTKLQREMGLAGRDSVQKLLTPEEDNGPSIGKRIEHVAKKNRRGTVNLSKKERRALRAQQDVPHKLAQGISTLIGTMGFAIYKKMRGWQSVDHLVEDHPLRNSIEGKNLSIERDWDDAHSVTAELENQKDASVFFRVSITKAGRHQHSGINVQNNTTLRVMVSAANATLDMTNQDDIDGFWLTVAQASKIFKVENILHEKILAEIQQEFAKKFGKAQTIIQSFLETGKLDESALFDATGEISMEQLNAIYAVADLKYQSQSTNALTNFFTTLGFELDGKTDGPSHMMNNFGQGLLTLSDYLNFQRVGMFLGDTLQTLNNFFADQTMKDLYNEASVQGMNKMYSEMASSGDAVKEALFASSRFAERFGDFVMGDDGLPEMTRDTTKNPMTKTVYGAGLAGVARGMAEDMIMGFYRAAAKMPKGADPAEFFGYPSFEADFELLFKTPYPKGVEWKNSWVDKKSMNHFSEIIEEGIGNMVANSAKEVIGEPITKVADLLVFITNVQTEFMKSLYKKKLAELVETRAKEGKIARHPKTGKGIAQQLTNEDYAELDAEIETYGPTFENGVQTLAVGSMSPQTSLISFSATMRGSMDMKSNTNQPEDARVKVIPYLTQGRGDAMVVNTIFGEGNPPGDMVAVHDGFYVPINKIKEYSKLTNGAVMKVWDRDVLGDTVASFEKFIAKIGKENIPLVVAAFKTMKKKPYDTTVTALSVNDLMNTLKEYHRANQARKAVFKEIPLAVNHLGGGQVSATRNKGDGTTLSRDDINERIGKEMGLDEDALADAAFDEDPARAEQDEQMNQMTREQAAENMRRDMNKAAAKDNTEIIIPTDETHEGYVITSTKAIIENLLGSKRLVIQETVRVLSRILINKNFRVVIAKDRNILFGQYAKDRGHRMTDADRKNLGRAKAWVNLETNTIYVTSSNHETLVHEMIHIATYQAVIAHYDGSKPNIAVTRLEALMKQFMDTDYSKEGKTLQRAVNATRAAILGYQGKASTHHKAAALNEFMAWTLSNAALAKDLKGRKNPLTDLLKRALILIKRIMGRPIPDDMYTHILFNTLMLDEAWAQKQTNAIAIEGLVEADAKNKVEGRDPFTNQTVAEQITKANKDQERQGKTPLLGEEVSAEQLAADKLVIERRDRNAKRPIVKETPGDTTSDIEARTEVKIEDLIDPEEGLVTVPAVGDGGNTNGVGNDRNNDGNDGGRGNDDGGVTPQAAMKTNFWINLMRKKLADIKGLDAGDPERGPRVTQFRRYRNAALEAIKTLDFGGFVMNEYEKHTFRSIHMVLATEMRLNTQSAEALNKMYAHITENLKPEMFGKGRHAQELYSTVMDLFGATKNDEGVSDALAVLLALSQTSKLFREALDQLPIPEGVKVVEGSLNGYLTGMTAIMMSKALGTINIADSGATELLDTLARNLIREDTEREYTLLRSLMGSLDKADKFMSGALNQLSERAAQVNQNVRTSDRTLLTKLVASTFAASTAFLSADRAAIVAEGAKRVMHIGVALDHAVFLREFITEVIGADSTNAEVMKMLDRTNYEVQAIRQNFKEQLPVIIQNAFETHPDEAQWAAFHKVLATLDFAHLFDVSNPERAFNLLKDASLLSSKTVEAEAAINKSFDKATAENILEKAKQLAGSMNGKGDGHQLLHNAHAINKLAGKYNEKMTGAIDTLISLYALESADQAQKDLIVGMYETDPEAIHNIVTYIQALNVEEEMKVFSEGARMQGRKGWIPDHGKKNALIVIQRDDRGDEMIKMGYVRVGDVTADKAFSTVKRGYWTTTVRQGTAYSQGVLQSVQGTYRGVNAVTGISVAPNVSGVITGAVLSVITGHLNRTGKVDDNMEVLSPVHDENGEIWAYERIINPDIMAKYAQPKSNLALMLGAWAGRQVEEKLASQYNRELITELKRIYDERKSGDDKLFVDISDPKLKDAVYRESWNVISPDTRKQIEAIFKGEGFFIRKDMVNLSLGYSDPTIVDVWTGKSRMPKGVQSVVQAGAKAVMGDKAVTIMSRGEEGVQGVVSKAKDIIIVRSLIVPYMNTQANVVQLITRGVPLKTMTRGYVDKMAELERFNENDIRLMEIKTNIALAGKDKNQVRILEGQAQVILDENARMSIAPLIKAGQYKNISEGITELDVELTSGRMAEWVENQVNRLPGPLQTITKYGLLSKDTAVYKFANKAVQYGDFLAKAIYYDHLTKVKGVSGEAALKQIQEEYVNFSILPGRTRSALESVGATWFLSFKIRTMKVALNVMRENPARALILMGSGIGEFGSPTNDNLGTVIFQERFGYSIGWTMLMGSPELNPWAQLWGWS